MFIYNHTLLFVGIITLIFNYHIYDIFLPIFFRIWKIQARKNMKLIHFMLEKLINFELCKEIYFHHKF